MSFDEPSLHEALTEDDRYAAFRALFELLTRSMRPTVLIIEDVHWADDATLDIIKFLGRRIDRTHALLILTFRDETSTNAPLRAAIGDLPQDRIENLPLPPALSLLSSCRETFRIREAEWPPVIEPPPDVWKRLWAEYVSVYNIPWASLEDASEALEQFWAPVVVNNPSDGRWDPDQWEWARIA